MSTDTAPTRLSSWPTAFGPRGGLVLLVAIHMAVTFLQAWPLPALLEQWLGPSVYGGLPNILMAASEAVWQTQLALIAAYVTLGSGWWLMRLTRGGVLLLWLLLAYLAGSYWLDGGRDLVVFQEFLVHYFWTFCFLALPLWGYRLAMRRQIAQPHLPNARTRIQFRIVHLFLVMTEAAAVMAAIRALVPWQRDWREQIWNGFQSYLFEYASYDMLALAILATAPAVLITLRFASLRRAALFLATWEVLLSLGFLTYRLLLPDLDPSFSIHFALSTGARFWLSIFYWLNLAAFGCTGGLVVWTSLAFVRWLGYRFSPLPRRGGGRQSSEATSVA